MPDTLAEKPEKVSIPINGLATFPFDAVSWLAGAPLAIRFWKSTHGIARSRSALDPEDRIGAAPR